MQRRILGLTAALAAAAFVACSKDSTAPNLLSDSQVSNDVATTSGSAMANDVNQLVANEGGAAAPGAPAGAPGATDSLNVSRTVTCYDSTGAVQGACNATTTDSAHVHLVITGTWADSNFNTAYSIHTHRVRDGSITNLLGTETFRIHNAVGTSNDTTSFSGARGTRDADETAVDSIVNIRFDLPRSSHPWPTSGQIIRNVSGNVTLTGTRTGTRSYTRRVTVTFPADAQGNVTLTINGMTCNLNLVNKRVTSCQ